MQILANTGRVGCILETFNYISSRVKDVEKAFTITRETRAQFASCRIIENDKCGIQPFDLFAQFVRDSAV